MTAQRRAGKSLGVCAPFSHIGWLPGSYLTSRPTADPIHQGQLSRKVHLGVAAKSMMIAVGNRAVNGVRERLAKASAADTSRASVASSELPAVGGRYPDGPFAAFRFPSSPTIPHHRDERPASTIRGLAWDVRSVA